MTSLTNRFELTHLRHTHSFLGMMLITLHLAIWEDFAPPFIQLLLLSHLAACLFWQPLKDKREHLSPLLLASVIGICILFITFSNSQLINLWQLVLIGILGGRDLSHPRDRTINLISLLFLTCNWFTASVHQLFLLDATTWKEWQLTDDLWWITYGGLLIPTLFLAIPPAHTQQHRYHTDFFHAITLILLLLCMALASVVLTLTQQTPYPLALFQVALSTALLILLFSGLWLLIVQQQGVEQLWTNHLFNIGNTLEIWLENLAQPAHYKTLTPEKFLLAGLEQLSKIHWIAGLEWRTHYGNNRIGQTTAHRATLTVQMTEITVYARYHLTGSQYFQIKLLLQLLEHFHQAKRREQAFAQQAHLQAIHETGAKLTHDIKNLLQSLHAISSAIEHATPSQFGDTQRLLQGQMPHLTQRLKRTLDKLQKPAEFTYSNVPAHLWWGNLKARYGKQNITFYENMLNDSMLIPEDLFDNVVENLLQNALMKRKREQGIQIEVSFTIDRRQLNLTVCDDGSAISPDVAQHLMQQPVNSKDGFGVGLYQVAKQLTNSGYQLRVSANFTGNVCFELASVE